MTQTTLFMYFYPYCFTSPDILTKNTTIGALSSEHFTAGRGWVFLPGNLTVGFQLFTISQSGGNYEISIKISQDFINLSNPLQLFSLPDY